MLGRRVNPFQEMCRKREQMTRIRHDLGLRTQSGCYSERTLKKLLLADDIGLC